MVAFLALLFIAAVVAWVIVSFALHLVFGHFLLVLVLLAVFLLWRNSRSHSSV
jgi:hypothetical protein